MTAVRVISRHEGDMNAGFCILQKPEVFHCPSGLAQLYRHSGAG